MSDVSLINCAKYSAIRCEMLHAHDGTLEMVEAPQS